MTARARVLSAGLAAQVAPRVSSGANFAGVRPQSVTAWPQASSRVAIAVPMMPIPITETGNGGLEAGSDAAIDIENMTVDEARSVRGEKHRRAAEFLDLTPAAGWCAIGEPSGESRIIH
jgi:hypothetical protein